MNFILITFSKMKASGKHLIKKNMKNVSKKTKIMMFIKILFQKMKLI